VLLPLTIRQTRSIREMQMIQPEVKKIQAKYKGNRQKMNEEMMALYKEHGINPLGGCLPLLLQMPVFIALFNVLRAPLSYMGYRSAEDGWRLRDNLPDVLDRVSQSSLAQGLAEVPDKVNGFLGIMRLDCTATGALPIGDGLNPTGVASACPQGVIEAVPYLLLIALMGFSTMYSQKQMQASRPAGAGNDPAAQQQQLMMKIMPIMFVVFGFNFPAGLTLYWTTSNLWTIVQQAMMLRLVPHKELPTKASGKGKGDGKGNGKAIDTTATATPGAKNKGTRQAAPKKGGGAPKQGSNARQGGKKKKR
jgi:YidC/Oxa1 family membrane protein insertase